MVTGGAARLWLLLCVGVTAGLLPGTGATSQRRGHTFLIFHDQSSKCLNVEYGQLKLGSCADTANATLWTWGSGHRLYNPGSQMCLELDLAKPDKPLKLVSCDSRLMLWWRCSGGHVIGASGYGLAVKDGAVTGLLQCNDTWRLIGTSDNICEIPYHVVYTTGGNSYGKQCEFPFRFNGSWHHDCISDAAQDLEWCSTSGNYDTDGKRGNCLKPITGCNGTWNQNAELQQCYQFNDQSVLKWKEAYMACKSQEADLLSVSSLEELKYITDKADLPDFVWTGLHRLESSGGWQWSDKSPLNFVYWDKDMASFSAQDGTTCGRLNVNTGQWDAFPCEASLPYICKKRLNSTASNSTDYWHYSETTCEGNWTAYNGFCYKLQTPYSWDDAERSCIKENASLISLHSLADIELVVTTFQNGSDTIWSGFHSTSFPFLYTWTDGSEVQFTYWDQNEPLPAFNVTPSCVSLSKTTGRWHASNCSKQMNSVCKRPGKNQNATKSDSGCPADLNWRRHGEFCYYINKTQVLFHERCNLTITNQFEQEFLNSLIREQTNTMDKYFWTSLQDPYKSGDYYWQTAEGEKDFPYSNWDLHEPAFAGGCVAMAAFISVGKWEVQDCKTFKAQSICKRAIGSAEAKKEVPKTSNDTCPDGWTAGSGLYCYKLFNREQIQRKRTWHEAEGICQEFGGHLASFSHISEMKNFRSLLNKWVSDRRAVWVGLNKRNLGSWEWSDDRAISSTILNEFQEDDYFLRDCAAVEVHLPKARILWTFEMEFLQDPEYSLHPYHCDAQLEWVCQLPKGAPVKIPEWYHPGWKSKDLKPLIFRGSEYWLVSNLNLTHREAALYCAVNGSELAAVESYSAMMAIQKHIYDQTGPFLPTSKWWVKSTDFRSHHQFILHRILGRGFNHCPFLSALTHFLEFSQRVNCNEKLPFVCKSQNFSMIETGTAKPTNFTGTCSKGWIVFENKCYLKVPVKNMNFTAAVNYCEKYGATLPSISNQQDQDFVVHLSSGSVQKFWIGLRLTLNSAQNSWLDGSGVTYTNFNPLLEGRFKRFEFDPFNKETSYQCLFMLNDPKSSFVGTWDFTSCAEEQPLTICQKSSENGTAPPAPVKEDLTYEGKSYKILQKAMTWYAALEECRSKNMELVSITDQYQLSFLSITARQVNRPLWIGLSSTDDGIHYRWQDGNEVTLNRWSEEEKGEDDCVYMSVDGTWKTKSCDTELAAAICHQPTDQPKKPRDSTFACPHKVQDTVWIPYQNNCYAFLLSHKRWTQNDSRYPCDSLNPKAFVLSIRDEDEKTFIFDQLQPYAELATWVWLGMIYDVNEKSLQWHDKTFVKYSNWRYGRPEVTNNSFYAAMKIDGYWDIFHNPQDFERLLLKQHSIVACKIEGGSTGDHSNPLPATIPYANSVYFVLKKKLTWIQAVKECKQNNGNLVSVHDNSQQLFLENIVRQDGFPLWIGLWYNDGPISNEEWSDGSKIDYKPVSMEALPPGSCAYLDTKRMWRARKCSDILDGAICYRPSTINSKSAASDSQCPQSAGQWVHHQDFCYGFDVKIYNYSVYTSEQARKLCQSLDSTASLLTIKDDEENAFVGEYLRTDPFITRRVWLGVDNSGGQNVWLDGSPMKYSNWSSDQGKNSGSCAVLLADTGTWNKVPCAPGHGRVICKSPAKPSRVGFAVGFAIIIILILLIGLVVYLYKKRHPFFFSSVRYRRAEDQMESMIDYA